MKQKYTTQITIGFRDADPAKIMFFGNIFSFAHDAFEKFITHTGFTWQEYFTDSEYLIPIRHTEADYLAPLRPGETYDVEVTVEALGITSFKIKYVFKRLGKIHATSSMVHAVLNKTTKEKIPLPEIFKTRLGPYLE